MWAIRHLLQACEYGKEANCVPLLFFAAKALWNAAAPVMGDETNGEQASLAVKAALYTIPTSYRPAATALITRMCMGLLWFLPCARKWDELFRTAEGAMVLVPKVLHTPLMKLQILALIRTETPNLFPTVCNLARSEPSSEADLLLCFARLAQKTPGLTSMVMDAYEGALTLFEIDKDPHGIVVHLEVAEWLLSMRRPWAKASSHIRAALDLLKNAECQQKVSSPKPKEGPNQVLHTLMRCVAMLLQTLKPALSCVRGLCSADYHGTTQGQTTTLNRIQQLARPVS